MVYLPNKGRSPIQRFLAVTECITRELHLASMMLSQNQLNPLIHLVNSPETLEVAQLTLILTITLLKRWQSVILLVVELFWTALIGYYCREFSCYPTWTTLLCHCWYRSRFLEVCRTLRLWQALYTTMIGPSADHRSHSKRESAKQPPHSDSHFEVKHANSPSSPSRRTWWPCPPLSFPHVNTSTTGFILTTFVKCKRRQNLFSLITIKMCELLRIGNTPGFCSLIPIKVAYCFRHIVLC